MKNFVERLKVCWYVLTMRNYFFAAYKSDRKMLIVKDGKIVGVKENTMHGFYHIDNVLFYGDGESLRQLVCDDIKRVVNKIKNEEI